MINRKTVSTFLAACAVASLAVAMSTPGGVLVSSIVNPSPAPQEQDSVEDFFERIRQQERRSRSRSRSNGYGNRFSRGRMRSTPDLLRWKNDQEFPNDVFTFARIQYTSDLYYGRYRWGRPDWTVDMPDSDNNFSFRLNQLTSMKVHFEKRGAVVVRLDEKEIYKYPFCYLIEPGRISLTQPEVEGMRQYLQRGGFIMCDDFWGNEEWLALRDQMKIVFPKLKFVELDLTHEIFNNVYKLDVKPQIPSIGYYYRGQTRDRWDAREAHYQALYDEKGRMIMLACHNTDLGDGWEREGMDAGYFKAFSEKYAYPLGINIITYILTH